MLLAFHHHSGQCRAAFYHPALHKKLRFPSTRTFAQEKLTHNKQRSFSEATLQTNSSSSENDQCCSRFGKQLNLREERMFWMTLHPGPIDISVDPKCSSWRLKYEELRFSYLTNILPVPWNCFPSQGVSRIFEQNCAELQHCRAWFVEQILPLSDKALFSLFDRKGTSSTYRWPRCHTEAQLPTGKLTFGESFLDVTHLISGAESHRSHSAINILPHSSRRLNFCNEVVK